MFASTIRVDRLVESDVGRVVPADHAFRAVGFQRRVDAVGLLLDVPTIVDRLDAGPFEATRGIGKSAPAFEGLFAGNFVAHECELYAYTGTR
jgi:hypothetical protein